MTKHTIFKSYGMLSLEEMKQEEEAAKEYLADCYPEDEPTETRVLDAIYDNLDSWYDCERANLNKELEGRILCIASMGLWNGRKSGYKILGRNLKEVLTCGIGCDEKEVFYDGFNVQATGYHHDGRNYVEFREIREDKNIDTLLEKIYNNIPVSRKEINYYTRSLRPYVKKIYGW